MARNMPGLVSIDAGSSDCQPRQHVSCLLGAARIAQHVVAARHQLHGRGEIALPARGRIKDRRGDNTEDDAADEAENNRRKGLSTTSDTSRPKNRPSHAPDTMPPPMTLPHVSRPITFSTCIRSTRQWSHPGPRTPDPTGSRRRAEPLRTYRRNRSATLRRRGQRSTGPGRLNRVGHVVSTPVVSDLYPSPWHRWARSTSPD